MKKKLKKNQLFQSGPKSVIYAVIGAVITILVLAKLTDYTQQVRHINYTEFIEYVKKGQVKEIRKTGKEVRGTFNDQNGTEFETTIENTPGDLELLKDNNVIIQVYSQVGQFSMWYLLPLLTLVGALLLAAWFFMRQSRGGSNSGPSGIFSMGKSRARLFMPSSIKERFDSVAGAKEAKEELQDVIDFLKNPEKYRRLGAKIPRGVLLVGEPGNGKTLLAKAVAGEANCPFFSITGSDFIEVFVGVGAARVRDLFSQARKHAPAIIFIDEIDAIGRQRGSGFGGGHDEREQTLNQLLTEMDGFQSSDSSVIVLAATNMPRVLDKAILRPGRFDRRVDVPYPDKQARKEILEIHAKNMKLEDDVDFEKIAEETAGFSGADLSNLLNKAAINASKKNQTNLTMQDLLDAHKSLLRRNHDATAMGAASNQGKSMFLPTQINTTFEDVAGVREAKEELKDVVDFLKNPKKYRRLGAKITRGVLLIGEPGNGKTLLAKAVAGEANCPFYSVSGSEFVEKFVGVGASRVRELFNEARRHNPSIIFIDEIDAVGSKRTSDGGSGGNQEHNQTLNQLLTELDGFNSADSSVIIIGATNRADSLDKALLRPGRFDRRVEVSYPDLKSREEILRLHTKGVKIDPSVDLHKIARGTPGFSGASLANLINEAALNATKNEEKEFVTMEDFEEARDKIMMGKESKTKILTDKEKEVTAYHEAGHALIRLLLPEDSEPLHKVTIIPRGHALGVTHWLPERDKYTQSKKEMIASIKSALGGRAAEQLIFNILGTGAYSDFEHATGIARKMTCYYGMTDELGPVVYKQQYGEYKYSEKTAEKIDSTVQKILEENLKETIQLLETNKDKLEKLAQALLEKETLYADEIYELLGITPRTVHKFA